MDLSICPIAIVHVFTAAVGIVAVKPARLLRYDAGHRYRNLSMSHDVICHVTIGFTIMWFPIPYFAFITSTTKVTLTGITTDRVVYTALGLVGLAGVSAPCAHTMLYPAVY